MKIGSHPHLSSEEGGVDPSATFIKRFGDLVMLLRVDPGNDAAQDLALSAAAAAVGDVAVEVEAGIEWGQIPDDMGLKARMLARQVDRLRIEAGTDPFELQSLARALAHDLIPIPTTPGITVDLVRLLSPPSPDPSSGGVGSRHGVRQPDGPSAVNRRLGAERRQAEDRRRRIRGSWSGTERRRGADRRISGERRVHLIKDQRAQIARLRDALAWACRTHAWEEALHAAYGLARLVPRVPQAERRMFGIEIRRSLQRLALEGMVEIAERDPSLREHAAEVLRWVGLEAVDVVLDRLRAGEALGVRVFFYDLVGSLPEAYPMVAPMLRSADPREVRHGAAIIARFGAPDALELLVPLVEHPDELVRSAAIRALGELHGAAVGGALRTGLRHAAPRTRAAAAEAVAAWRGGALAALLITALQEERDRESWQTMVTALGSIGSAEACAALAAVALTRRGLLRRGGYSTGQRLAAVAALGLAGTDHGVATLERLARTSDGVVGYAADRMLRAEGLRAG